MGITSSLIAKENACIITIYPQTHITMMKKECIYTAITDVQGVLMEEITQTINALCALMVCPLSQLSLQIAYHKKKRNYRMVITI